MDLNRTILRYLPQVYDLDPEPLLALRVTFDSGSLTWIIKDDTLTLTTDEPQVLPFDLREKTIGDLATEIESASGPGGTFTAAIQDTTLMSRPAITLIDGAGDQAISNGDHLLCADSLLWTMLGAMDIEIQEAGEIGLPDAIEQMVFTDSGGHWLDLWGAYFGIPRLDGMNDADYGVFLREEIIRPRNNALAIENTVLAHTDKKITIREPWKEMMILDVSPLNGRHYFQDGNFYTYNVIQPHSDQVTDWTIPLSVIHRNRPIGTYVHEPNFSFGVDHIIRPLPVPQVSDALTMVLPDLSAFWPGGRLDVDLLIGDYLIPPNPLTQLTHSMVVDDYTTYLPSAPWIGGWDTRTWADTGGFVVGFALTTSP